MKRIVQIVVCLLLALGCWPSASWGQEPVLDEANAFITRWKGEVGKLVQVPLYGNYAYSWEKADGTVIKADVASVVYGGLLELPVAEDGEYVLKAGPTGVKRIEFGVRSGFYYKGSRGTPEALLEVVQWGSVAWENFAGAFYGCANMSIADGAGKPDRSGVTSMYSAFRKCSSFNSPIGKWDVSKVTDMTSMFSGCRAFNQPLEKWDVSKVTDMASMLSGCSAFNQPLAGWDVSKVTNIGWMFSGCSAFNQPLAGWNVSKVTIMYSMFKGCGAFNQPLEKWDVSKVTNMGEMFSGCSAFNQPLEKWDVSKVKNMYNIFEGCSAFNQPLGQWTLSALAQDEFRGSALSFSGSGLSESNYSETLVAWAAKRDSLQEGIEVDETGLCCNDAGMEAMLALIEGKKWMFLTEVPRKELEEVMHSME